MSTSPSLVLHLEQSRERTPSRVVRIERECLRPVLEGRGQSHYPAVALHRRGNRENARTRGGLVDAVRAVTARIEQSVDLTNQAVDQDRSSDADRDDVAGFWPRT